jgi:hypothetical protein
LDGFVPRGSQQKESGFSNPLFGEWRTGMSAPPFLKIAMPTPEEHKTVQARILAYAEAIGWTIVSREAAEKRRAGFPTRCLGNGGQECPRPLFLK